MEAKRAEKRRLTAFFGATSDTEALRAKVGRCRPRLTVSKPELKYSRARLVSQFQRLKLKCDEPLSNVAFNVNVRRYT